MKRSEAEHRIAQLRGEIDRIYDVILNPETGPGKRRRMMTRIENRTSRIRHAVEKIGAPL